MEWKSLIRVAALACCVLTAVPLRADHALTQAGKGLFNVRVEANTTTWSRPLRVVHTDDSFTYDYETNEIRPLLDKTSFQWIMVLETTSTKYGKQQAREFMAAKGWNRHIPPPPRVFVPPVQAPPPTPTPTPTPTPDPGYMADQTKPIGERVAEQMQLFIDRQSGRASELRMALNFRNISDEQAKEARVQLIRDQISLMKAYYPTEDDHVKNALADLERQLQAVMEKGKFAHEP